MEHNSGRPRAFTTTGSHIGGTTREEEDPMALQMDGSAQLSILNSLLSSTNKAKFLVRSPTSLNVRSFVVFVLFLSALAPSYFPLFCFNKSLPSHQTVTLSLCLLSFFLFFFVSLFILFV